MKGKSKDKKWQCTDKTGRCDIKDVKIKILNRLNRPFCLWNKFLKCVLTHSSNQYNINLPSVTKKKQPQKQLALKEKHEDECELRVTLVWNRLHQTSQSVEGMACVHVNSGFTSPQVGTELRRCDAEFRMTPLVNLKYKNVCMHACVITGESDWLLADRYGS